MIIYPERKVMVYKDNYYFHGSGRWSDLVRLFLLKVYDWLKSREDFDYFANDVRESYAVSVSGRSKKSGLLLKD